VTDALNDSALAARAVELAREAPELTALQIADLVGLPVKATRAALRRAGLVVTSGRGPRGARPRAVTYSQKRVGPGGTTNGQDRRRLTLLEEDRPRFRFECETSSGGERPCPWVGCRYHLAIDVNYRGALKVNFPGGEAGVDFDAMADTCALDVAARGGATLEATALRMNLTRERARQLEDLVFAKVRAQSGDALAELLDEAIAGAAEQDRRVA
jgi:hypothetical protein